MNDYNDCKEQFLLPTAAHCNRICSACVKHGVRVKLALWSDSSGINWKTCRFPNEICSRCTFFSCRPVSCLHGRIKIISARICLQYIPCNENLASSVNHRWHGCDVNVSFCKILNNINRRCSVLVYDANRTLWKYQYVQMKKQIHSPLIDVVNFQFCFYAMCVRIIQQSTKCVTIIHQSIMY